MTTKEIYCDNETGEGKCSVPMWMGGCPAGTCGERAFGKRPNSRIHRAWWGDEMREDGRYNGHVPNLACPMHGGPRERVFKDGNSFCAVMPDFINLQESIAGFGPTQEVAVIELKSAIQRATGGAEG